MPSYSTPEWNAEHAAVWRTVALESLAAQFPRTARSLVADTHPRLIAAIDAAEARIEAAFAAADWEALFAALAGLANLLGAPPVPSLV